MFKSERITTTILAIVVVIIVGFVASRLIGYLAYQHWTKDLDEISQRYRSEYAEIIKKDTDSNKLVVRGEKQIKSGDLDYALITLKQATIIDPKYRDAWLFLGYAEMKNGNFSMALTALKKAESIDPIYKQTYELLVTAYDQLGDKELAGKAKEKIDYLKKNSD